MKYRYMTLRTTARPLRNAYAVSLLVFFALFTVASFAGCSNKNRVVVYAPASMAFMEEELSSWYKETKGIDVDFVLVQGLVDMLEAEKKHPKADVVIGLTTLTATEAKNKGLLAPYKPNGADRLAAAEFVMDPEWYVSAFDYGALAITYNAALAENPPRRFVDMPELGENFLVVQNPHSATGQEMLLWSYALYGDGWEDFWRYMKPAIYGVAPDWNSAYTALKDGEAPLMIGFVTSDLYFADGTCDSYIPEEGGYIYLEGAALIAKKQIKPAAKSFMNSLWDPQFQKIMLEKNGMLPVTDYALPESYAGVPFAERIVRTPMGIDLAKVEQMKARFIEIMQE